MSEQRSRRAGQLQLLSVTGTEFIDAQIQASLSSKRVYKSFPFKTCNRAHYREHKILQMKTILAHLEGNSRQLFGCLKLETGKQLIKNSKKDTHDYNNYLRLRSRAIKK